MAWCLMAVIVPSQYLSLKKKLKKTEIMLIFIKGVLQHSPNSNFPSAHELNPKHVFSDYTVKITAVSPKVQWVEVISLKEIYIPQFQVILFHLQCCWLGLKGVQIFVTGYSICQHRPVTEYSYVDTEVPAIVQVPVDSDAHGESSFCFHSPVQNITLSVLLGGHSR